MIWCIGWGITLGISGFMTDDKFSLKWFCLSFFIWPLVLGDIIREKL